MIAIALAAEPDVLIADEPTTALDATIQLQILDLLKSIQKQTKLAIVFITHDLGVVARMCDRVAVMYAGRTVEVHALPAVFDAPSHPYTDALIKCLPALDFDGRPAAFIPGEVPVPGELPAGCAFHPRCPRARDLCTTQVPASEDTEPDTVVACHYPLARAELVQ
jgi:oligopeptide/dipeptide ABC transporter ATP-binding protein